MLFEYLLFLAKTFTLVIAILIVIAGILAIASKNKGKSKAKLEIKKINDKYAQMEDALLEITLTKAALKQKRKAQKKAQKSAKDDIRKRLFLINFHGDIKASSVKNLREEVTALLTIATPQDEVVLCLESAGGMVHTYGLAASQLQRIRDQKIPLIIMIDKVAASGGYMMASVGNTIFAAPFAVIGSVGVIAQLPNFHRLLKKKDIDFEQIMAGQYKRTLTVFGENTEQGREKFQEEVNDTHELFKAYVKDNRPSLNIEKISTGEHWYGARAIELGLIDNIQTSDDYLLKASKDADIYELCYTPKKSFVEKLSSTAQKAGEEILCLLSRKRGI